MDTITINWHKIRWKGLKISDNTVFYAFTRGSNLVYIGKGTKENVTSNIEETLKELGLHRTGLSIWFGEVDFANSSFKKLTKELVNDAYCLLIYLNKPYQNNECIINYQGRKNFNVLSNHLLKNRNYCDKNGDVDGE